MIKDHLTLGLTDMALLGPMSLPILGSKKIPISGGMEFGQRVNGGEISSILTNFITNIIVLNIKHFSN